MGSPEEKASHSMSCCQNSTNSENISTDENSIEDFEQGNNNTVFHSTMENTVFSFPKRQAVDLEFKDMRFTVKKLSLAKRRIGECFLNLYTANYTYIHIHTHAQFFFLL